MTKTLTIRLAPSELAECDARASELGVTRTDYVRFRLFDHPAKSAGTKRKQFASTDLVGSLAVGKGSTNAQVRMALRKRK